MKPGNLIRIFLVILLLIGTVSSITLYFMSYRFPHKIPLRARQVTTWTAGGAPLG